MASRSGATCSQAFRRSPEKCGTATRLRSTTRKRLRYDYLRNITEEAINLARDKKGFVKLEHGSVDEKVYDAVCKGEYDKATVRSDNFDIEKRLFVRSQSLLYRANL